MSDNKMDPAIKAEWVADLRENADKQGRHYLRTHDDKFCCLGRLCELAVKHGVIGPARDAVSGYAYSGERLSLPWEVQRWAGISEEGGLDEEVELPGGACGEYLSRLNDTGATFLQIADLIEEQF